MKTALQSRMLAATNPLLRMIEDLQSQQDDRNSIVFEMADRLRETEPEELRNQITKGMS